MGVLLAVQGWPTERLDWKETMDLMSSLQSLTGSGSDKDESEMTWEEKKELERKRKAAQKAIDRERKEKHRLMEEEREKVRQQLREKYNLEKPESVEEPEEDSESSSSSSEEEEEDESVDEEKVAKEEAREKVAKKIAIMMSSIVTGLFSVYLLVSFVHLKIKASVSNMRPYWDSV